MHTTSTTTIFLVDDHPIVRLGYRMLLDADSYLHILGEAENGADAIDQITASRPDVAIVDLSLPDISGFEVTRQLQKKCPEVKILVVSAHRARSSARTAVSAGAEGYIIKDKAEELIRDAIDDIIKGRTFICNEMQEKLGDELHQLTRR